MSDTVLVTGGSAGIGRALTDRFAASGDEPVLVARTEADLETAADEVERDHGVDVETIAMDLTTDGAVEDLLAALADRDLTVDVLVNNVGIGTYGPFHLTDPEREADQLRLNVEIPVRLTRQLLPGMVERDRGGVLNVSSTAAFSPGPKMAGYYASKAYILRFSQALTEELRDTDVTATALCPGPVDTGFQASAGMEHSRLATAMLADIEVVARAGHRGFRRGRAVVIPGWRMKALAAAGQLAPGFLARRVTGWLNAER